MQLLKLVQNHIQVGTPLPWGVRDAEGELLLARGQVVASQSQLEALLSRGAFVDADEAKAVAASRAAEQVAPKARPANLFGLWEQAIWRLDRLLRSIESEGEFQSRADALARDLIALVQRDTDIAIFLAVRQSDRFAIYGLTHALHTALVCMLMAKRLDWDEQHTGTLVVAALTMNVSVFELQGKLAAQGIPPTASQKEAIHGHPLHSVELLKAAGITDEAWLTAVAQHHERADGSGYPHGLKEISELGQALRYADVFMAKISRRTLRAAMPIQQAARELFQEDQGGVLAAAIIKELGIYPPGNFVKLRSGEIAIVVRRGATANTPMVASLSNKSGVPILHTVSRSTAERDYEITAIVPAESFPLRVPPERLYGLQE
jgi:HD-GYP domain-containing protein (c-di-GMP phosphodiesterase class II)